VTPEQRLATLEAIASEVSTCTRCPLSVGRNHAVPGEGSPETEVVLVGEGPGFNEDQQGRPFVGAAGTLLNQLIRAIGWRREDVFITNVVKCRPPGNRDPEPGEIAACAPYLRRQLEALDPAVVITLGRHSLQTFMPGARIGQAHGTLRPADPATGARDATVLAMYHPAAALRQNSLRETMLEDMARVPQALIDSRARRAATDAPAAAPPSDQPIAAAPVPEVPSIQAPEALASVQAPDSPVTIPLERTAPATASEPVVPGDPSRSVAVGDPPEAVTVGAGDPTAENQMELF
jgi:uracil-DNA glycosylase